MAGEVATFGIGVTILVTGTYDTEIITDAGTTDSRVLDGPYARHHRTMDKRGRAAMKRAPSRRIASRPGSPRRSRKPSRSSGDPVGPDARMLLVANRLLPGAAMHTMTRLMMGIPRFGALRGTSAATMGVPDPHIQESDKNG